MTATTRFLRAAALEETAITARPRRSPTTCRLGARPGLIRPLGPRVLAVLLPLAATFAIQKSAHAESLRRRCVGGGHS